jgi:hypothetical protein
MALTENEKKVLGLLTDNGTLRGELRERVSSDDILAREQIALYKANRIAQIDAEVSFVNAHLEKLNTEKQLLENVE